MKRTVLAALLAAFSLTMFAVPAKRFTREVITENGEKITITRVGDEFGTWWVDKEGKVVNFNAEGKCLVTNETSAQRRVKALAANPRAQRRKTIGTPKALPKVLVVLVNYKDKKWNCEFSDLATDQLNLIGYNQNGNIGSVREYFQDASNDAYNPEFAVYGPMTLENNMKYYGGNSSNGDDKNPQAMILEAAQYVYDLGVDLSEFDSDGDGAVDFFAVWYAGYSEAEDSGDYNYWGEFEADHPDLMWPHQWELSDEQSGVSDAERTFGNTKIDSYFVFSELRGYEDDGQGNRMSGIGTFCHEFSHALGLPDFYATESSNVQTLKYWDIMDYGPYNGDGCIPPTYSAYERYFMKWMTPTVLNTQDNFYLNDILSANEAYMVSSDGALKAVHASQAYYLLENRQQVKWDKELPGAGMMITKVTYNATRWTNNTPNDNVNNMGVDIIEAKSNTSEDSYASDLFPTGAKKYTPYSQYPITDIRQLCDKRIWFKFMNGTSNEPEVDCNGVSVAYNGSQIVRAPNMERLSIENIITNDCSGATDPSVDPSVEPSVDPSGCVEETFAGAAEYGTETGYNISEKMDDMLDLQGWTGEKVFVTYLHDGVRVGTSSATGYITSPALGIEANMMKVTFKYSNHDSNAGVEVSIDGGGYMANDLNLVEGGESTFIVNNPTADTKVTFSTTGKKKRFYLESFKACPVSDSPITALEQTNNQLNVLVVENGLQIGDIDHVEVYSAQGHTLYSGEGNRTLTLNAGMYIVRSGKTAMKFIVR